MPKKHIKDVGPYTIDFSKVSTVGPVTGEKGWEGYTVNGQGIDINFYQSRQGQRCFPREEFVKLWKSGV